MSRKLDITALASKAESGNNSSVRRIEALEIAISDLALEEPFKSLFAIREDIKSAIRSHMLQHGYDESKPVDVWKRSGKDGFDYVLVDGFTRTQAAEEAGRLTVTAYLHAFDSVEEARNYAIHTQRDRRNLSDSEIMSVLSLIDKKVTGFKTSSSLAPDGANGGPLAKTAQRTAKEIGTSARKVERARKVASDPNAAAAVRRGELSINKAYEQVREREKTEFGANSTPDAEDEGSPQGDARPKGGQAAIFASAVECLRNVLPCGVELIADDDGESGRIIISFKDVGELHEVVKHVCAAGPTGGPRTLST
jgi:ParB family chromosome partitioning protein